MSYYAKQAGLELVILLPSPPKCWDYKYKSQMSKFRQCCLNFHKLFSEHFLFINHSELGSAVLFRVYVYTLLRYQQMYSTIAFQLLFNWVISHLI